MVKTTLMELSHEGHIVVMTYRHEGHGQTLMELMHLPSGRVVMFCCYEIRRWWVVVAYQAVHFM